MKIVAIDAHNFLHRARAGFTLGDYPVVFNFMRNLRSLIELHEPSRVYFVLEGHPKARHERLPSYKANRRITGDPSDPVFIEKTKESENFFRQVNLVVDLLKEHFPVSVVRHPDFECDDVIYNLIKRSSTAVPWTVVSNDSDFIQLLNEFSHVSLYNPMTKTFVEQPPYDYVAWKSLRGDGSDNIPGLPGIGDKRADELVNDPVKLSALFEDRSLIDHFSRNHYMIKFMSWSDEDAMKMTSSSPTKDWDAVAKKFDEWQFKSILKEKSWDKYKATFNTLWE